MYRDRGVVGSKSEIGHLDRKRINDALDKHLEKSSPSTSRSGLNGKEKDRLSVPSTNSGKPLPDHRDNRSASLSKNKHSDDYFIVRKYQRKMSSSSVLRELQHELESKANDLSKLQKDIAKNHQVRKKYTIQCGENELVLKELELLSEDANVFKLIGPVLVKQDLAEATSNVKKRMEYISAELTRLDGTLEDLEAKQNSKKESIMKLQQRIQGLQAGKAKA